jgi:hypothetical protein
MTQFANISAEARNIVINFFNAIRMKSIFAEANKQLMVSLYKLMPYAEEKVLSILNEYIVQLNDYMSDKEITVLLSEYTSVISFCFKYSDPTNSQIVHALPGCIHMPTSLIDLCMEIAKPSVGHTIYLPFTGEGSFLFGSDGCDVEGFEIGDKAWALSKVVASAVNPTAHIQKCTSLSGTNCESDKKYNFIFCFPPMLKGREARNVVDLIYHLITKHLENDGEFYAIMPRQFCNDSSDWFGIRKILWDKPNQFSTLIISLPAMLQPVSNVELCLVHYCNDGMGKVVLADASSETFFSRNDVAGIKEYVLKVQTILETIKQQDERYVWVGTANQLTGDVNLQPSRYLLNQYLPKVSTGERLVPLSKLVELVPLVVDQDLKNVRKQGSADLIASSNLDSLAKVRTLKKDKLPLLGMKELSGNYLNCDLNREEISMSNKTQYHVLVEDSLIVGFIGNKFKVAKLHGVSKDSPVNLRPELFPFKIISSLVTEDYLLRALMSEETEIQAKVLASGVVISRLAKKDLLSIQIVVPTIERQIELCKEDTRKCLTESDRKIIESHEEFRKDMHMKKHAIGQTIFNLNNWWKVLQKARKEGDGVVRDTAIVGKSQPIPVADVYMHLQEVITKLQVQINKLDRGNGLEVKNIALTEFIEEYISNRQNQSPLFKYLYDNNGHRANQTIPEFDFNEETGIWHAMGENVINEGDPIEYVDFAPEALKIIFDNIVSNATSHGFDESDNRKHYIKIELSTEGTDYVLTISNNGNPLDAKLSDEDVFVYNKSSKNGKSHFGIGGYEIYKLMREFGGDATFVSNPASDFPVAYKLIFHKTNIIKSFSL